MTDKNRCVVTGLGLICSLGDGVEECWNAAVNGVSGIKNVKSFGTESCYSHLGAEVEGSCDKLPGEGLDRSARLCIKAAEEAFNDAGIDPKLGEDRIGVIMGSCVGGAASIDKYYTDEINGNGGDPADILKMSASAISNSVSDYFELDGITANIVNACAAGTMSIAYACDLIRAGKGDVFAAGGTDSFSSLAFSGFHALHALDPNSCSPFNHSSGITLGEGSGVLIIESYEHAVKRGAKIYCDVLGAGISSDAYHITAPRPDGAGQMSAIRRAVENSSLSFEDIDYINAHGTGTAKNDEAEFLSLHTLFDGNSHLSVSSTKSMTGHCLGAAGSIEAVFTVKAIENGIIPPTTGYSAEDLETLAEKSGSIDFVPNTAEKKQINFAMSNSFAFGGNNAGIIFSREGRSIEPKLRSEPIYITGFGSILGKPDSDGNYVYDLTQDAMRSRGIKPAFSRKLDRFSQLQLLSGATALENAGITVDESNEGDIGILIGTADGPLTEITTFQKNAVTKGVDKGSAFSFPNTVYNAAGGYLSIFTGIKGYNVTIANGAQAGLQSVCTAADVIKSGAAEIMLASGTDENTASALELYKKSGQLKNSAFGEGSVTLVLETESSAEKRGAKKYAVLAGYAVKHRPAPYSESCVQPDELTDVISAACADAGVAVRDIDAVYFNSECMSACGDLFDESAKLVALDALTGCARAAQSAASVLFAAEAFSQDDNLGFTLAVSSGAGGCCSAVVLKRA